VVGVDVERSCGATEEVSGDARWMIGRAKDDDGSGFEKTRYVKNTIMRTESGGGWLVDERKEEKGRFVMEWR
jgi:hypothetical protein